MAKREAKRESPAWTQVLKKSGLSYEGFVDSVEDTLEAHGRSTLTTYGTRVPRNHH